MAGSAVKPASYAGSEEEAVLALLNGKKVPRGVSLHRVYAAEDQSGDPGVFIEFKVPGTFAASRSKMTQLRKLAEDVEKNILDLKLRSWPYVRFIEG